MSLDLSKLTTQAQKMIAHLAQEHDKTAGNLVNALSALNDQSLSDEALLKRIASAKTSWLVARASGDYRQTSAPSPAPADYTALATDGSQIELNRHSEYNYYLINTGSISLSYGRNADAFLENKPKLFYTSEDMIITPPDNSTKAQVVDSAIVALKRDAYEAGALAELTKQNGKETPIIALLDGTLIKWLFNTLKFESFVVEELLDNGFLKALDEIYEESKKGKLALASYISNPGSSDVINMLRVKICPFDEVNCDSHCRKISVGERKCDGVNGITDSMLFSRLLSEGERSAVFASDSKILEKYGRHSVYFYYVKLEEETARVEIPEWVAFDNTLLELTHTLILDQARRGHGYPVALSEAHEQAVVTFKDREHLEYLIDTMTGDDASLKSKASLKRISKQTRWV